MSNFITNIGTNVKKIRELKHISQEYMSGKLGISQASYSRIESGSIIPKTERLQKIADILTVNLTSLLNQINVYHMVISETSNQTEYVKNLNNHIVDVEFLRKIIREEMRNILTKKVYIYESFYKNHNMCFVRHIGLL